MPELDVSRSQWPGTGAVVPFPARQQSGVTGSAGEALATEASSANVITAVNAVATAIASTNTKLDTLATKLDSLATKLDAGNASLASIKTNTDRIP